ncbi:MAG: MotA/TolQ/ExbB proton channel family protein [Opitutales bacterium]|nr:MotA/TolQ/ExbB proton channel family protein [Opitutales bacterium]
MIWKSYFFSETIEKLGWMGIPLLLTSVVALALVVERCVFFARHRAQAKHLRTMLTGGDPKDLPHTSPLTSVAQAYMALAGAESSRRQCAAETALESWVCHARGSVKHLSMLAQIAPLLGLTGTVLGLVEAFRVLEANERMASPALLAGGIWEALLTTIAGMVISIPLIIAVRLFNQRIDSTINAARELYVWLDNNRREPYGIHTPAETAQTGQLKTQAITQ